MIAINLDLNIKAIDAHTKITKPGKAKSARVKSVYDAVFRILRDNGFNRVKNQGSLYSNNDPLDRMGPLIQLTLALRAYCAQQGYPVFQSFGSARLNSESDLTDYLGQVGRTPTNT